MTILVSKPNIIDYRSEMPKAAWNIGTRPSTRYITVHYNGPAVPSFGYPKGERDQLKFDARYHMRPGALGTRSGGDGIQYHMAVLSNGEILMLRNLDALLWHCANAEGNRYSLAIHVPLGGTQHATEAQAHALFDTIEYMRSVYKISTRSNVYGHMEWSNTACPGLFVMQLIRNYRISAPIWYKTLYNANCRQAPDLDSTIAAVTPKDTPFIADKTFMGLDGDTWVHRADHLGFYHESVVARVLGE